MEQREEMIAKMGNWTCVLRELKMVDKNLELDLESMLDEIKDMNLRDPWLLDRTIEDCRTCYAVSFPKKKNKKCSTIRARVDRVFFHQQ